MKINHYAVLPAQVRYDRTLSDKSILLYAELAAASNAYGICEEDNTYFAAALQIDNRTVIRCMQQLISAGHLQKFKQENKRRLRIVTIGMPLPEGIEIDSVVAPPQIDITPLMGVIFDLWDNGIKTIFNKKYSTSKKEIYENLIRQRLVTFSKEEILSSIKNRINFMYNSEWFRDNEQMAVSIEPVIKDDVSLLKWLNAKVEEVEKPKPMIKDISTNLST